MTGLRRRKQHQTEHPAEQMKTPEIVALEHLRALARASLALAAVADERIDAYLKEKRGTSPA